MRLDLRINHHKGIQIANACKIFYQKRPRLIPILDQYARLAFNIPWHEDDEDIMAFALKQVRTVALFEDNIHSLRALTDWLRDHPSVTGGLSLSKVRLLDILAWAIVRKRENNETW
jgi:hypothetical protein